MNKETLEKIYDGYRDLLDLHITDWYAFTEELIKIFENNGYHKLPTEPPPVLSDDEMNAELICYALDICHSNPIKFWNHTEVIRRVAQAQIDLLKEKGYLR